MSSAEPANERRIQLSPWIGEIASRGHRDAGLGEQAAAELDAVAGQRRHIDIEIERAFGRREAGQPGLLQHRDKPPAVLAVARHSPKPTRYGRVTSGPLPHSGVALWIFSNILIGTLGAFDPPPLRMTPGDPNDRTLPACIRASLDRDRQNTLAPAAYIAQY